VRRTRADAAATREAILDAAEVVFLEHGVARSSLEQIARRAGVTRGAIYWHFKDKTALFAAMVERVRLPLQDIADAYRRRSGGMDPLGMLRQLCGLVVARLDEDSHHRNVYRILMNRCEYAGEMNPVFERQRIIDEESLRKVEVDFHRARTLGQLATTVEPRVATLALYSLMYGIHLTWLRAPESFSVRKDGEAMVELFFAGLYNATLGQSST
jgi:TetR/AcrR family transcriptional regulator, repressor of the mexAB-oprM multidrug resistance operon